MRSEKGGAHTREPFNTVLDLSSGVLNPEGLRVVRRVSDLRTAYRDRDAVEALVASRGDPIVYVVYNVPVPEEVGELQHCTSIIYPGRVGEEYFMTKGHFHARPGTAEVYLTLSGEGMLLMQSEEGESRSLPMFRGSVSYIPPYWAHRSVNTGSTPLVLFAVYPGEAGHNYGVIEEKGFAKLVVDRGGRPEVVDNPAYGPALRA